MEQTLLQHAASMPNGKNCLCCWPIAGGRKNPQGQSSQVAGRPRITYLVVFKALLLAC